jgi:hypothetical protein
LISAQASDYRESRHAEGLIQMRWLIPVMAFALTACSAEPAPKLGISNATALAVTLFVNGQRIAEFPTQSGGPTIDVAALPPLPWNVEARLASGRLLTSMQVAPGQVRSATSSATCRIGTLPHPPEREGGKQARRPRDWPDRSQPGE